MLENNNDNINLQNYKNKLDQLKNITPNNNTSVEIITISKISNEKNSKTNHEKINLSNNNKHYYIENKKLFKGIKMYKIIKPKISIKKRNNSRISTQTKTTITEGSIINNNIPLKKKTHTNEIMKSFIKKNNPKKIISQSKKNKNNIYTLVNNSNTSYKSLTKSKSNKGFLSKSKIQNFSSNKNKKNSTKIIKNFTNIKNTKKHSSQHTYNHKQIISNGVIINNITKIGINEDKIKSLYNEIDKYKNELNGKNEIIKNQQELINKYKIIINDKNKKINDNEKEINELKNKNKVIEGKNNSLKEMFTNYEKEIKSLKEKEMKLMQILYSLKEKGININSIDNEVSNINDFSSSEDKNTDEVNSNSISDGLNKRVDDIQSSTTTVYFPDKIYMKSIMANTNSEKVPKLNFNQVPEYENSNNEYEYKSNELCHNSV